MAVDSLDPIPGRKQRDRDSYRVSFWYMNQQLWGTGDSSVGQREHAVTVRASATSRSPRHKMPFSAVLTWDLGSEDLLLWISGMGQEEGLGLSAPNNHGAGDSWALVLRGWICCILTAPSKQIQMGMPPIARPELGEPWHLPISSQLVMHVVTNNGDWEERPRSSVSVRSL